MNIQAISPSMDAYFRSLLARAYGHSSSQLAEHLDKKFMHTYQKLLADYDKLKMNTRI